ncbi:MAG TPA: apolipoprotein N-acyltransferase [Candidatus Binataceae bacterium]|nr:apolipoprotein N-acyltransferase [Candidatus Binataceae bacterium]
MRAAAARNIAFDIALLILGGLLYTLSFPPYGFTSTGWIALAPLYFVLQRKNFIGGFLCGLLFGIAICCGVAGWLYPAISSFFGTQSSLGLLLTAACFALYVGLYTGIASGLTALLIRSCNALIGCLAAAALWIVAEYARSTFFSGFSWGLLGYSQAAHLPPIQIADLTGIYGVSFLLALTGFATAAIVRWLRSSYSSNEAPSPWYELGCALTSVVLILAYGAVRLGDYATDGSAHRVRVALVRHDVPASERWERAFYAQAFLRYIGASESNIAPNAVDLIVWPEFASGFYLDRDPTMRLPLTRLLHRTEASLLVGGPRLDESNHLIQIYNSAYLFGPEGELLDTYDKIRLLPFAETRSTAFPPSFVQKGDYDNQFTPGSRRTIFTLPRGERFGVMICFEATYPEFARTLTANGAEFLVNLSNDVWLSGAGGSAAAEQHLAMAAVRAVENRRSLARATMAGINGFVDPTGRIYALSRAPEGVNIAPVTTNTELTVYTRYGDWFVALCAAFSIGCLIQGFSRRS